MRDVSRIFLLPADAEHVLTNLVASWYGVPPLEWTALGVPHALVLEFDGPLLRNEDLFEIAAEIVDHLQTTVPEAAGRPVNVRLRLLEDDGPSPAYRYEFLTYIAF